MRKKSFLFIILSMIFTFVSCGNNDVVGLKKLLGITWSTKRAS